MDPHLATDRVDGWGYSYMAVERPLVRVRELIAEESVQLLTYWRFNDRYGLQAGSGANGDLPNDFKFQFGGVVQRGPLFDPPQYAIYGSLFVLVPADDPNGGTRVFPPFQGNGGGPSGGPLFSLKGEAIDVFLHPTGVRPGSILQLGETASFTGYSAPTLPSKVEVVFTSPTGATRTITGRASRIGWFYDPAQNFAVYESGVWKAKVKITFDGLTSAGQVQAPYPTGGALGSRGGEFSFYVVAPSAAPPGLAPLPQFVSPSDGSIMFTVTPPAGITNVEMETTTTMPGFILEETHSALSPQSQALTYTYDAQRLHNDFPNLDLRDFENSAGADVITISFLVSGTDAKGDRRHFARQVVIAGEELHVPEQKETIVPERRRSVRR